MTVGVELQRASDEASLRPGEYAHVLRHRSGQMTTVVVCCPTCGHRFDLLREVPRSGLVEPAVSCGGGCGFFELLVLVGWARPN